VVGVHLDRRATLGRVTEVQEEIEATGRKAWLFNTNAADESKRDRVLDEVQRRWAASAPGFRVVLHSLAFGSLLPLLSSSERNEVTMRQLDMTSRVMAHSFVSWLQALAKRGWLFDGSRVFAMTSPGARSVWSCYGAVSAAKAALEAHVRQLAAELAPSGVTVNALCAGVTDTPALHKIPDHDAMKAIALRKNPHGRLTRPQDVADAIVALAQPGTHWINGNVIHVDGGEDFMG